MLDDLTPDLDTVLWNLLDACALGNRVAEQVYRMDSTYAGTQQVTLEALRVKPRAMYAFVVDAYLRLLGLVGLIPGVGAPLMQGYLLDPKDTPNLLPRDKFMVYSFRPVQQDPRGTSVLRPAYTPWNLKQQVIREHVRYLTQFAAPSLVGYTPENAQSVPQEDPLGNPLLDVNGNVLLNPTPEQAMQQALTAFRNGSVVALPGGSKLDVLFSTGEGGAFHAALDRYDRGHHGSGAQPDACDQRGPASSTRRLGSASRRAGHHHPPGKARGGTGVTARRVATLGALQLRRSSIATDAKGDARQG